MSKDGYTQQYLLLGLVPEQHLKMYHENPEFHSAIQFLAKMLPLFVDTLATEITSSTALRKSLVADLKRFHPGNVLE